MANTLENKSKFFAQYWGQEVAIQNDGGGTGFVYDINEATITDIRYDFLELKPISQISDEDRKEVSGELASSIDEYGCEYTFSGLVEWGVYDADYLRSRGYALPWMGLSVNQLVEYGWVKLKGEKQ